MAIAPADPLLPKQLGKQGSLIWTEAPDLEQHPTIATTRTGCGLSQLGARLGVGGILNELTSLFPLRIPEQLGHPLLGDDGGGLHAGDRCIELVDDRRHASLEMPTSHRNECLTAGGVQRPDEEIGGTTRTGEDPRTDP